jgi:hypothetical protein
VAHFVRQPLPHLRCLPGLTVNVDNPFKSRYKFVQIFGELHLSGVLWYKRGAFVMSKVQKIDESVETVRTSVTLSKTDCEQIGRIVDQKKVSIAWVMRDSVEHYLAANVPLFHRPPR